MMANDKQLDRAISRWLEAEAPPQLPDRVLRATFERTRGSKQQGGWRAVPGRLHMNGWNKLVQVGIGAAAVVVALMVGTQLLGTGAPVGAGATPTPTATPVRIPGSGPIPAGTYLMSDGRSSLRITLPAGWDASEGGRDIRKHRDQPDEVGFMLFGADINVYPDACATDDQPPSAGPTTDDLIAALQAQQNSDVSAPADITFGGRPGVALEVSVPAGLDVAGCIQGLLRIWTGAKSGNFLAWSATPSYQPATVYVVETSTGRIVFGPGPTGPDATAADVAERQAIIDSIQIEPAR